MIYNKKVPKIWRDSAMIGTAIFTGIATFMGVASISLDSVISIDKWWNRLLIIVFIFIIIVIVVRIVLGYSVRNGIELKIRGVVVNIRQGNIFEAEGWKVIPFNEYFDTIVDEVIISSTTLNGIFINEHISNLQELENTITLARTNHSSLKTYKKNNRLAHPLGRIITYNEYMLLAFSHFNKENVAHISKPDYEQCLFTMWKEIRRTYANKPVFLPLIGSGITSFDDIPEKSNIDLLKCIICTLRASGEHFNQPITILLTKEVMDEINLYEAKEVI